MIDIMNPVRTLLQQNSIRALLKIEKSIYDITKGRCAKNRFLSSVKIPHVGTNVKIIKETENSTYIAKLNSDGTYDKSDFRILCTTDLHLDKDYGLNDKTLQHFVNQIADLKPDLVVLTGDVILSKYQQIDAIQFAQMMDEIGVYWAYVFGNHEAREEKEYFKYLLYKSLTDSPFCLSKFGDPSLFGYGNFIVNIMNDEHALRQSLVFFDSGRKICEPHRSRDGVPEELDGCDYIKPSQIEWYTDEINSVKKQYGDVKSMIYLHIPLPEYEGLFVGEADGSYIPAEGVEVVYGTMREKIGCSAYNSGLFDAMKKNGSQAIFCGHDHCNDFCAKKQGIYMVYNQTGGYNCYRLYDHYILSPEETGWPYGVNFTDVHADGSLKFGHRKHTVYMGK